MPPNAQTCNITHFLKKKFWQRFLPEMGFFYTNIVGRLVCFFHLCWCPSKLFDCLCGGGFPLFLRRPCVPLGWDVTLSIVSMMPIVRENWVLWVGVDVGAGCIPLFLLPGVVSWLGGLFGVFCVAILFGWPSPLDGLIVRVLEAFVLVTDSLSFCEGDHFFCVVQDNGRWSACTTEPLLQLDLVGLNLGW